MAQFFLPFMLLIRVAFIFNFTFTDAQDFGPLFVLIIGVLSAATIYRARKAVISIVFIIFMLALSIWPIVPNLGLYVLAREFQHIRGVWPQVMVNDPKLMYKNVSPRFDSLCPLVDYMDAYSGAMMIAFLALFLATKSRLTLFQMRLIAGLTGFWLLIAFIDPGNLLAWWMD